MQKVRRNYSDDDKQQILDKFAEYVNANEMPIIEEFAYQNDVNSDTIRKWVERCKPDDESEKTVHIAWLSEYKKALQKQKAYLIKRSMKPGQNAAPMFLLKALHGLRDSDKPEATQIHVNLPDVKSVSKDKLEQTIGTLFAPAKTAKSKTAN